ncbi:MAG: hypothetical protein K0B08_11270 [Bacteroidales bacterium]|nr:hypothetical protein [Bacteroidales bacterium]
MKTFISSFLILAVLLFSPQLFAQVDVKSDVKQKEKDKQTEIKGADVKQDQPAAIGGYTRSGQQITPPAATRPPASDDGGTVRPPTPASGLVIYDRMGQIMASIGVFGMIYDPVGNAIGQYTSRGEYKGPDGEVLGTIRNGVITAHNGQEIGRLSPDGKVTDARGNLLGIIYDDGTIRNSFGSRIGSAPGVDKNISVMIFFYKKNQSSKKGRNTGSDPVFKTKPKGR